MANKYNQQYELPFPLTATGLDTSFHALVRPSPIVQQHQDQQVHQYKKQIVQQIPTLLHAPTNHCFLTTHPEHLQQEPTSFASPAPSLRPSSATAIDAYNDPDSQAYCDYLYQFGFLQGDFSDIMLSIPSIGQTFPLHSLIICRSPYLYQRLSHMKHQHQQRQNNTKLVLELDYKQVMVESFRVALSHLYRPLSQHDVIRIVHETPRICLELIGIAEYLKLALLKEGLIHAVLSQDFNQTSALQWIHLLHSLSSCPPLSQSWTHAIENRLLIYLVRDLPAQLLAFPPTLIRTNVDVTIGKHNTRGYLPSVVSQGMNDLASLYSILPWTYLKQCLKHPDLPLQDTLQHYLFIQKVLQLRSPSSTTAELDHEHITLGLRFNSNNNQQQQPTSSTHSSLNNNMGMALSFIKVTPIKVGKWDPSLYESELGDSDDERVEDTSKK